MINKLVKSWQSKWFDIYVILGLKFSWLIEKLKKLSSVINTYCVVLTSKIYWFTPLWMSNIFARSHICVRFRVFKSVNTTPCCPTFTCFWKTLLFHFCRIITERGWLFCLLFVFLFLFMLFYPILGSHSVFSHYVCWLRLK